MSGHTVSDLKLFVGHHHLAIVLLLFELRNTLMVTGNDARESRYNIKQQLLVVKWRTTTTTTPVICIRILHRNDRAWAWLHASMDGQKI